jgi:hypothetical protein
MADNESKVPQVCDVTGVSAQEALALLEMSNGNVDAAIGLYYETGVPQVQVPTGRPNPQPVVKEERPTLNMDVEDNTGKSFASDASSAIEDLMKKAVDDHGAKTIGEVCCSRLVAVLMF